MGRSSHARNLADGRARWTRSVPSGAPDLAVVGDEVVLRSEGDAEGRFAIRDGRDLTIVKIARPAPTRSVARGGLAGLGIRMPISAGWTLSHAGGERDTYDLTRAGRLLRIERSSRPMGDLAKYPNDTDALWRRRGYNGYDRIALGPTTISFDAAGSLPAYAWEFRTRVDGEPRQTRVWYFNWRGRSYAILVRSADLAGTEPPDQR